MSEEEIRYKTTGRAGIIGIIGNIFLMIIKLLTGFTFKSQAMIADAMNSAGDIFSSVMTTIGNKISSVPKDEDHNLGHGKAEYIFSLLISIAMILVAGKLIIDDITKLITNQNDIVFSWLLIGTSALTIIVKFFMFLYTYIQSKKFKNILLEANMKDHRNDCIVALCILISTIASKFGLSALDSVLGIAISIWIGVTGIKIFIESYNILMDKSIDEETKNKILEIVASYPEIKKYNHFNSSPVGVKYMISISIYVDGTINTFESHEIADRLEKEIASLDNIELAIIHVNPI